MEKGLYRFIWRYSKGHQIVITVVTLVAFPFMYLALELPKVIINDALGGKPGAAPFPRVYLGVELEQLPYLLLLCGALLVLLLLNGGFLMFLNTYKGITSERLLRRLRYALYERILRFPLKHFQKVSQGELTSMITAEVEPLSQFFADAVSLPLFQGGTMLVVLVFMFVQNPVMGLVGIAVIPLQAWLIPRLQHRINMLAKERVVRIRKLSGRISEAVSGINDIHTNDTTAYTLADFTKHLGGIFRLRYEIYRRKAFLKFINNFLLKVTPLLFYSVGGVLILTGRLDFGQLVAVLAAYSNLTQPWKELLKYYQRMADARIKYQQVVEQFDPAGMMAEHLVLTDRPERIEPLRGALVLEQVTVSDDDGLRALEDVSFEVRPGQRVAIVAGGGSRDALAHLLTRLTTPSAGKVTIDGRDLSTLHEAVLGARIGYAGPESYIFDATIAYNALYGLNHRAVRIGESDPEYREVLATGNSPYDPNADWIDYKAVGVDGREALMEWWLEAVRAVELEETLYGRAMSMTVEPEAQPELAACILEARRRVADRLAASAEFADLVHPFDFETYNVNASVGANLIFGEPIGEEFAFARLGENPYVREVLDRCGLTRRFEEIGLRVAVTLIDMFNDMSAEEPLFERYSFVDEEALNDLKHITLLATREGLDALSFEDRSRLSSLTFQLIVERHRLGFIDEDMQRRIVEARKTFRAHLPAEKAASIAFYDPNHFNPQLSLRCNLVMGRVNVSRPNAEDKVNEVLREVLDEMNLTRAVTLAAARFEVGIGGRRLPLVTRQSLALLRSIVKRPDILIANEALSAHDRQTRARIRRKICDLLPDMTVIWIDGEMPEIADFDEVLVLRNGRIEQRLTERTAIAATPAPERAEEPIVLNAETAALARVPLFSEMDPGRLKLLAFASKRLTFAPGEELFRQGDVGDAAYVILKGEVDVFVGEGENEIIVNRLATNELVGDMALLSTNPRLSTVWARTEVEVLELRKELFLELIEGNPHMAAQIARAMSDRLYNMTERLQHAA